MVLTGLRAAAQPPDRALWKRGTESRRRPVSARWKHPVRQAARYSGRTPTRLIDRHAVQHYGILQPPNIEPCPAEQRAQTQELYQAANAAVQREFVHARRRGRTRSNSSRKEFRNNVLAQLTATAERSRP